MQYFALLGFRDSRRRVETALSAQSTLEDCVPTQNKHIHMCCVCNRGPQGFEGGICICIYTTMRIILTVL